MCVLCSSLRYIHEDDDSNEYVMYDLDELDLNWLESVNTKRKFRGMKSCYRCEGGLIDSCDLVCRAIALAGPKGLEEATLREALLTLETKVYAPEGAHPK